MMEWLHSQFNRKSAAFLWGYLCPKTVPVTPTVAGTSGSNISLSADAHAVVAQAEGPPNMACSDSEIFMGYASDLSDDDDDDGDSGGGSHWGQRGSYPAGKLRVC